MNYKYKYFGCTVHLYRYKKIPGSKLSEKVRFGITDFNGYFRTYPYICSSVHSALMKAWYCCKWMYEDDYDQKFMT